MHVMHKSCVYCGGYLVKTYALKLLVFVVEMLTGFGYSTTTTARKKIAENTHSSSFKVDGTCAITTNVSACWRDERKNNKHILKRVAFYFTPMEL